MPVIINELEVVLEPPQPIPIAGAKSTPPDQPQFTPQDFRNVMEREQRNRLRLQAH
jgi:hypothetical protein